MPLGQTLGVQLQLRAAQREAEEQARKRAESAAELRKLAKERDAIRDILEEARQDAFDAVTDNRPVKGVKVKGYGMPFIFTGRQHRSVTIADREHPYHDIYREFAAWAETEGVRFAITDEHDGVGMESWHRVSVVPA